MHLDGHIAAGAVRQLDELPTSYERFLVNGLRENFDFPGVPIRLTAKTSKNPFAKKWG